MVDPPYSLCIFLVVPFDHGDLGGSSYREEDLQVLNVFMYTKFAQIGHNMNPAKIVIAFQFISRSLTLLRRSEE